MLLLCRLNQWSLKLVQGDCHLVSLLNMLIADCCCHYLTLVDVTFCMLDLINNFCERWGWEVIEVAEHYEGNGKLACQSELNWPRHVSWWRCDLSSIVCMSGRLPLSCPLTFMSGDSKVSYPTSQSKRAGSIVRAVSVTTQSVRERQVFMYKGRDACQRAVVGQ